MQERDTINDFECFATNLWYMKQKVQPLLSLADVHARRAEVWYDKIYIT